VRAVVAVCLRRAHERHEKVSCVSESRAVVVSGAGSGIGRAVAHRLVANGVRVVAVGRRRDPLQRLVDELGDGVDLLEADVATPQGATAVARHIESSAYRCAGVVAAAGGLSPSGSGEGLAAVMQDWQASFESNVLTAVLLIEALHEVIVRDADRVVLLSSVAALRGSGGGPYGAMKGALHAWMYDLARDLGMTGGTANAVAPGFVPDTEFWAGRLTDESRQQRASQTLVGREGSPEEVASLIAWLLGPNGGWMTGQVLSPNGGSVLGR
jgi:3-oxoacyl-[acyl-carrier protein] reductase